MTLLFWVFSVFGSVPVQDTVSLEQVEVYAPPLDRFAQGQKLVNFDYKVLEAYSARSLGELLQERSPVFVFCRPYSDFLEWTSDQQSLPWAE
jgi:vitamin B12 transporter